MGRFEDLVAYRQAVALADDLRAEVETWPSLDQWTVGVQLIRAADSVGANIAEAFGRETARDERRFLLIARGSAHESAHWIERATARSLLADGTFRLRAKRVSQLVNGLLRAHRRHARASGERRATSDERRATSDE